MIGAGALAGSTAWLVLVRGEPTASGDQGILLSVAARMLHGDELYSEVIETRIPSSSTRTSSRSGWRLARAVPPRRPLVRHGALGMGLLLRGAPRAERRDRRRVPVYPLALTSGWYLTGLTMLGALAFVPWIPWAWLSGRHVTAGVLVGAVLYFKLNLAAVAVAPLVAFVLLGAPVGPRVRQVARAAAGLVATLVAGALLLAIDAGFIAYLESIQYNAHYANGLLASQELAGRLREHFNVVLEYFRAAGRWQYRTGLLVTAAFAGVVALAWTRYLRSVRLLASTATATLALTLVSLAFTAYWVHHLQMLAYPATAHGRDVRRRARRAVRLARGGRWSGALHRVRVLVVREERGRHPLLPGLEHDADQRRRRSDGRGAPPVLPPLRARQLHGLRRQQRERPRSVPRGWLRPVLPLVPPLSREPR